MGFSLSLLLLPILPVHCFHDLTLSPPEQWFLCLIMGLTIGLQSRKYLRTSHVERDVLARDWESSVMPQTI